MNQAVSYKVFTEHETSRMLFEGAINSDIQTVFKHAEDEDGWINQWKSVADTEASMGSKYELDDYTDLASESYIRAANYHRLAQYHILADSSIKGVQLQRSHELYQKGITLKPQSYNIFEVVHNTNTYKGYMHFPNGFDVDEKYPVAIVVPGLGHNRESVHNFCQAGAANGIITVAIDGPGYGERIVLNKEKLDINAFSSFIDCVINHLEAYVYVDNQKIGLFGDCFGAYLSFYTASKLDRVKACVMVEGILEYGEEQLKDKPLPLILTYHLCADDCNNLSDMQNVFYDNNGNSDFALYLLHAKEDHLIPYQSAENFYNSFNGEKHLEVVEGPQVYENYLINHYNPVLDQLERHVPKAWGWMHKMLSNQ